MTTSQKLLEKLQSELSAVLQEKEALEKLQKETADKEKYYEQLIDNYQSKKEKMIEEAQSDANEILESPLSIGTST